MLKNVSSRWARGIERSQSGRRRINSPIPVPMQVEQLEPRQLMTATVGAPSTPVFSETYFIGSTVKAAAAAGTKILEVDRPIPVGFTLHTTGNQTRVVESSTTLGNGNTQLTLDSNLATIVANGAKVS